MEYKTLAANGPVLLMPRVYGDDRGYFMETYRQNEFEEHCGKYVFVQDNQSSSQGNVLRGLHYQLVRPQGKLVRVILGSVFDVAVDLRRSSPTFGKNFAATLSDVNHQSLWVPPGFAHGFYVLSERAIFVYKCTDYYSPENERCILWNDPDLAIAWPLVETPPILSAKDRMGTSFAGCETFE